MPRPWPRPACRWRWSTRARSADFARATGRLAKTDRLDAKAIARFAEAVRPPVRPLPEAATRHLAACWRAGASCSRCWWPSATAAGRRSSSARADRRPPPLAGGSPGRDRARPRGAVRDEPGLARQGGAAPLGAGHRPGERAHAAGGAARARLAHPPAGRRPGRGGAVQPRQRQERGKRTIWGGRAALRACLYMAAVAAARGATGDRRFYRRLRLAGKPAKLALTACMRKLVVTLNAMLRTNTAWKQA